MSDGLDTAREKIDRPLEAPLNFRVFLVIGGVIEAIVLLTLNLRFSRPIYLGDFIIGSLIIIVCSLFASALIDAYRGETA